MESEYRTTVTISPPQEEFTLSRTTSWWITNIQPATTSTAVPLTVDNVINVLQRVDTKGEKRWFFVANKLLDISKFKIDEIARAYSSDEDRLLAVVKHWIKMFPNASWRWLMRQLDYGDHFTVAHWMCAQGYPEPLSDPTLTLENVLGVTTPVLGVDELCWCMWESVKTWTDLHNFYHTYENRRAGVIDFWLKTSPYASWTSLAGRMYYWKQIEAIAFTKKYLPQEKDPTLTKTNFSALLRNVRALDDSQFWMFLDVPDSVFKDIKQSFPDPGERNNALVKHYIDRHPAPSWKAIATAVYTCAYGCQYDEDPTPENLEYHNQFYRILHFIHNRYLNRINSLQSLCIDAISNSVKSTEDVDLLPLPKRMKALIKL